MQCDWVIEVTDCYLCAGTGVLSPGVTCAFCGGSGRWEYEGPPRR